MSALKDIIRQSLQDICTPSELGSWFDPLTLEFDAVRARLTVSFPHAYFEGWFSRLGKPTFEQCAKNILLKEVGKNTHICYVTPALAATKVFFDIEEKPLYQDESEYSFATFIANGKNEFPLAAARSVCDPHSGRTYNPFIICGKSGTGKTHLLRAMVIELAERHGQCNIFNGSADTFSEVLDKGNTHIFFQNYAAFIVDDVHRMAHNLPLQEKIIQILDDCLDSRRQMIFACHGNPSTQDGLTDALRSRLEVGLIVELKEPDIDVRMRFTQLRCRQYGLKLDKAHMLLLAQRCVQLRHLSGGILKVSAFQSLAQRDITTADIENILSSSGENHPISADYIINTVAAYMTLAAKDILGSCRKTDHVRARQTAMYLCRELLGMSYPALGRLFGGKDHSTIIHSIKKIQYLVNSNKDAHQQIADLKKQCLSR